ncbi:hypothetical protein [Amaricoccus solimangrovi]|uniref:hypothetical protein n=1 Tax=Amaricoccus solimangrovi TaxID=2589815 RepID=UPI0015E3CEAD|nr:hypothetical protein [Amaricoccus solimangrovi]
MLLTLVFIAGFAFGWYRARTRGGDRLDRLQYGTVHGILFTLVAFVGWIVAIKAGIL